MDAETERVDPLAKVGLPIRNPEIAKMVRHQSMRKTDLGYPMKWYLSNRNANISNEQVLDALMMLNKSVMLV